MSCSGCRVLRKGCSDNCALRSCLQWIESPEAQAHATVFVAKFFGRAALMNFLSAVPQDQGPALFQSLLYEAAGRTVNPVNGAVGLLSDGNWQVCQAAVETILRGGVLEPIPEKIGHQDPSSHLTADGGQHHHLTDHSSDVSKLADLNLSLTPRGGKKTLGRPAMDHSEESAMTSCGGYQSVSSNQMR